MYHYALCLIGARDPISSPHACGTGTLLTEPPSQLKTFFQKKKKLYNSRAVTEQCDCPDSFSSRSTVTDNITCVSDFHVHIYTFIRGA